MAILRKGTTIDGFISLHTGNIGELGAHDFAANDLTVGHDLIVINSITGPNVTSGSDPGHTHSIYDKYNSWTAKDSDGTTYPITSEDTLQFIEGAGIDVNFTSDDALTFSNTDKGSTQNIFKNFAVLGQSTISADSNNDTLTFESNGSITITTDANSDKIIISSDTTYDGTVTSIAAGNGMDFTSFTTTGSIALGIPQTITSSTLNSVTTTSHTHELGPISMDDITLGILTVNRGGTGLVSVTSDSLLTGNGTDPLSAESNLTFDGTTLSVSGDIEVSNVSIAGNLTVNGSTYFIGTETIDVSSSYIFLNTGLSAAPVSSLQSGIMIGRGSAEPYAILYDESTKQFRIGITSWNGIQYEDASMQSVGTREDNPIDTALMFWDDSNSQLKTSSDLIFSGSVLSVAGTISANTVTGANVTSGVDPGHTHTAYNNYSLSSASASILGGIKLFSDTVQSIIPNAISTTAGRTYGIQINSENQAVVNIPWESNVEGVTSIATSGAISGGTITGTGTISHLTTSGYKHIPSGGIAGQFLKWDSDGSAIWGDANDTIYTAGTGISIIGSEISNTSPNIVQIIPTTLPASDVSAWAKEPLKPSYTYSDVGAEPAFSKNSAFNKDFGYTSVTVAYGNHTHSYLPLSGGTLTGDLNIPSNTITVNGGTLSGHLLPDVASTIDLGSALIPFRGIYTDELYLSANSLYVNGKKVIHDDSNTITVSTDVDQDLKLQTSGLGDVNIISENTIIAEADSGMNFNVPITHASKNIGFNNESIGGNISFNATGENGRVQFYSQSEIIFAGSLVSWIGGDSEKANDAYAHSIINDANPHNLTPSLIGAALSDHGDHGLATHKLSSTDHPRDTRNQISGTYLTSADLSDYFKKDQQNISSAGIDIYKNLPSSGTFSAGPALTLANRGNSPTFGDVYTKWSIYTNPNGYLEFKSYYNYTDTTSYNVLFSKTGDIDIQGQYLVNGVPLETGGGDFLPLAGGALTGDLTIGADIIFNGSGHDFKMNMEANGNEYSFDFARNGFTGGYWQVWDSALSTLLKVEADTGKVTAPYTLYEGTSRVYSSNNKPTYSDVGAAASVHTHSYLPLSGGTLSGTINGSDIKPLLQVNTSAAYLGSTTRTGAVLASINRPQWRSSDSVYHDLALESNFDSYLPISGGTLTGDLILGSNTLYFNSTAGTRAYINGNSVLTFGSDDTVKFYESDSDVLRVDWSMNSGTFNFIGTLSEDGYSVYHTGRKPTYTDVGALASGANAVSATKLATARTIDITGDITATAVAFDGTANIAISAAVNDNSHNHNWVNGNGTTNPDYALEYFNKSASSYYNPSTSGWYNSIRMGHGDPDTYYNTTIAIGMTENTGELFTRVKSGGTEGSWKRIYSDSYHPLADSATTATTATSCSGNAATANNLKSISTSFSGTYPVAFNVNGIIYSEGAITFNGTSNTLATSVFSGALSGNATTATTATTASKLTINSSSSASLYNMLWNSGTTVYGEAGMRVQPSTDSLFASGDITAYYSDERLKEKTGFIENAVEKVLGLDAFLYVENDLAKSLGYSNDKSQIGLSAQQVQAILPEIVSLAPVDTIIDDDGNLSSKSGENYLTINYAKVTPLLVAAIQEQQSTIESQQKDLDDQNDVIKSLIYRLEKLENNKI